MRIFSCTMPVTFYTEKTDPLELAQILQKNVRTWFTHKYPSFSLAQLCAVYPIYTHQNVLVSAPTGSTKTLTAFLAILNQLVDLAAKNELEDRTYAIYVSPLKALNYDIEQNLLKPLTEIAELEPSANKIRIGVRTGDTPAHERAKMQKLAPHILITTPESLALLLISTKMIQHFAKIEWVIIDEIHALANNKRGEQLSVLLEQLQSVSLPFSRVGLSATVAPLPLVAQYLVGANSNCLIIDVTENKSYDIQVVVPANYLSDTYTTFSSKLYDCLHSHIQKNKTTIIFTNTRAGAERVVHTLKQYYPDEYYEINEEPPFERSCLIAAHHSSISFENRRSIEHNMRSGKLRCIVTSTSLELGIDVGFVELVILLASPKSVARLLQRVGRAGHQLNSISRAVCIAQSFDELFEFYALRNLALKRHIEQLTVPIQDLDVLSQCIIGLVVMQSRTIEDVFSLVKQSFAFQDLSFAQFFTLIETLTNPEQEFDGVYAPLILEGRLLRAKPIVKRLFAQNVGTISDKASIAVKMGSVVLGDISEEFLEQLKPKDIFVLGGETYRYEYQKGLTIQVSNASGIVASIPQWFSQAMPLTFELAQVIQQARCQIVHSSNIAKELREFGVQSEHSALLEWYFSNQKLQTPLMDEQTIQCEVLNHQQTHYVIIHTSVGLHMNRALGVIAQKILSVKQHIQVQSGATDMNFFLTSEQAIDADALMKQLQSQPLAPILESLIDQTSVVSTQLRHVLSCALVTARLFKRTSGQKQMQSRMLAASLKLAKSVFYTQAVKQTLAQYDYSHLRSYTIQKYTVVELHQPSVFSVGCLVQSMEDALSVASKYVYMQQLALVSSTQKEQPIAPEIERASPSLELDARKAVRSIGLDSTIAFELFRFLEDDVSEDQFSPAFRQWLVHLLSSTVPTCWSDMLIKYLTHKARRFYWM